VNGQSAINAIQAHYAQVPTTDANSAELRTRILFFLQTAFNTIWLERYWTFAEKHDTITATDTSTQTAVPSDFGVFHPEGGLFLNSTGEPIVEEHYNRLVLDRGSPGAQSLQADRRFALSGINSSGVKLIEHMAADGNATIDVFYQRVPPTITDAPTGSNLEQLPVQYHETVLIPLGVYHYMLDVSRSKADAWLKMYQHGLAYMARNERSKKTKKHVMPVTTSGGY
jgi:hypothetical protein